MLGWEWPVTSNHPYNRLAIMSALTVFLREEIPYLFQSSECMSHVHGQNI